MSLGGNGASSGDGGGINVNNYGTIITSGSHSGSILAQSIGGGGGRARASGGVLLSLGGDGSGGGNGGYVGVSNAAYLVTQGFDSTAILAQSVGGGGGVGGSVYGYGLGFTYTRGGGQPGRR